MISDRCSDRLTAEIEREIEALRAAAGSVQPCAPARDERPCVGAPLGPAAVPYRRPAPTRPVARVVSALGGFTRARVYRAACAIGRALRWAAAFRLDANLVAGWIVLGMLACVAYACGAGAWARGTEVEQRVRAGDLSMGAPRTLGAEIVRSAPRQ